MNQHASTGVNLSEMGADMRWAWRTFNPSGLSAQQSQTEWFSPERLAGDHLVGVELDLISTEAASTAYQEHGYAGAKKPPRPHNPLVKSVLSLLLTVEIDDEDTDIRRFTTTPPNDSTRTGEVPARVSPNLRLRLFTEEEAFIVAREGLDRLIAKA